MHTLKVIRYLERYCDFCDEDSCEDCPVVDVLSTLVVEFITSQ